MRKKLVVMQNFEKMDSFYLGKIVDPSINKSGKDLLLLDSKDLTTHAVCVGMTGSGKTGMGITLLEEAGINKIPSIVIDPKGDLANLLLTFPKLTPEEFQPWIEQSEAERKGLNPEAYAKEVAEKWKQGLAEWGESAERIKKFRDSVDLAIYTPANEAGLPISILNSFAAPSKEESQNTTELRDKILSTTSSLLGLLGIAADPIKSREHILLSTIISQAWQNGKNLDIASLIYQVQNPPFSKIGALDVDTFYPAKERMGLSISLNNLLASPGFQAWMEGAPLDIKTLLYTKEGKPKISIISIAHLSDSERMFFVTLLLNAFIDWMRHQEGTSSLRAILYMDEIFGFFPPTAMPPSKLPMLTLLKQARAFGVGVILVTQNPVDLDYKGLSNCGMWFIGKLQTERDKTRVIEGLKAASNGEIDANSLDKMIALLGNRTFMMRSVHKKDPILFQTRWTLSYLRGPLTLAQIASLTDKSAVPIMQKFEISPKQKEGEKSSVPANIEEFFFNKGKESTHYEPRVLGIGKLHFIDSKLRVDTWQDVWVAAPTENDGKSADWQNGTNITNLKERLERKAEAESSFGELPFGLMQEKTRSSLEKAFAESLYQNQIFSFFRVSAINLISEVGESEADFRIRAAQILREKNEEQVKKVKDKYSEKIASLTNKVQRAQSRLVQKQQKAGSQKLQTFISFGTTLLGTLFGKGITKGTISQTGSTLRRASQIGKESQQAADAEEELKACQQQLDDLNVQMNQEITDLSTSCSPENIPIESLSIRPKKSDISIEKIALLWWPQGSV